jgi:hypothetical protein
MPKNSVAKWTCLMVCQQLVSNPAPRCLVTHPAPRQVHEQRKHELIEAGGRREVAHAGAPSRYYGFMSVALDCAFMTAEPTDSVLRVAETKSRFSELIERLRNGDAFWSSAESITSLGAIGRASSDAETSGR